MRAQSCYGVCVSKQSPPSLQYRLDFDKFDELTEQRGWLNDSQRARGIGVSHTTIGRLRRGKLRPGLHFIGQATKELGVEIEELFKRVEGDEAEAA